MPSNPLKSVNDKQLIQAIDAVLPQTQCQACSYAACLPYATAIVSKKEKINRCLPGGVDTLHSIAALLSRQPEPAEIEELSIDSKPSQLAVIREQECIGCTKCIQACPVDAIIGSSKQMHTILSDICTGCELCIPPCPVDCIDLLTITTPTKEQRREKSSQSKQRYIQREARLQREQQMELSQHQAAKLGQINQKQTLNARQAAIQAAVARKKSKHSYPQSDNLTYPSSHDLTATSKEFANMLDPAIKPRNDRN